MAKKETAMDISVDIT